MPAPITHNEKPAAATDHGGLDFVWTTTAPSHGKDSTHDLYHIPHAPFKAH